MKKLALAILAGAILLTPHRPSLVAEELCGSGAFLRFEPDPMEDVPAVGRKALIVGVGTYDSLTLLRNPANDARDMAGKLRRLGFGGACGIDIDRDAFVTALEDLRDETTPTDTAFVYFAGHGASVDDDNYLAVTNTSSHDPHAFKTSAIGVIDGVVQTVLTGRPRRLVVVTDACRNKITWKEASGRRGDGVADSFLSVPIPLQDQDPSLFIGYGTGFGMWADDGNGKNGLFTAKLASRLGLNIENDLRDILERVEDDFRREGREQRPERVVYGFGDRFYPRPPAPRKAEFNQRAAQARQTVPTDGCKYLREVASAYEEWQDNMGIATDYKQLSQELENCLNSPPDQLLLAQLSEISSVEVATTFMNASLRASRVDFDALFPDLPLSGPVGEGGLPSPTSPTPPAPPEDSATIRFAASNEIDATDRRILADLVDRAGDHNVSVTAVVPRDDTFAEISAHARIATVLESLTSAGIPPNHIKLIISSDGLVRDAILVRTDIEQ